MKRKTLIFPFAIVPLFFLVPLCFAEEGMWLFSDPPKDEIREKYGFEPPDSWLETLQKSSIRFGNGGSASFVSSEGLIMTNHHVGYATIQKLSSEEKDYIKDGFYAKTREEEIKCPDLELIVLQKIEDVTERVLEAVKADMSPEQAEQARRTRMNSLEKESFEKTGFKSEVVALFHGGRYHLYQYKTFTDVRFVFAPEQSIAFFGGDPDNFEYPRYDLDVSFFRAYENDEPYRPEHFLKWSTENIGDEELVFVSGHPGRTERFYTIAHLEFQRDVAQPRILEKLRRRLIVLKTFAQRSAENKRRVQNEVFGIENSLKVRGGMLAGLQNPGFLDKKQAEEEGFRLKVYEKGLIPNQDNPWKTIAEALYRNREIYDRYDLLEGGAAFDSQSFRIAKELLRWCTESEKPDSQRLREYRDTNLESRKRSLLSPAPIYEDVEILKLGDSLSRMMETLGASHPVVLRVLEGESPARRAAALVLETKVRDLEFRKEILEGGRKAVESSTDPMIRLARILEEDAREVRKISDDKIQEPIRQAYEKIAKARFAVFGTGEYPDATFTLRLSYGTVKGYREDDGTEIPPWTLLGGTFLRAERHDFIPPYNLPQSWIDCREKLDPETPMNLVSTNDIIGGNSGSPLVNAKLEVVGLIFDGNLPSLVGNYVYTEEQARSVSVHSAAILEALKKVYQAEELLRELVP